jgi:anti-sigma regulatory factor (Ser/Thr protein kinase)
MSTGKRFPPQATSAAEARSYVHSLLSDCDKEVTDAVVLLTSELVSNAIVHGDTAVTVDVVRAEGNFLVSVSDESHEPPELRFPDHLDPNGRGLSIVNEVSDAWGVERGAHGKTVWFTVTASPPDQ